MLTPLAVVLQNTASMAQTDGHTACS